MQMTCDGADVNYMLMTMHSVTLVENEREAQMNINNEQNANAYCTIYKELLSFTQQAAEETVAEI